MLYLSLSLIKPLIVLFIFDKIRICVIIKAFLIMSLLLSNP